MRRSLCWNRQRGCGCHLRAGSRGSGLLPGMPTSRDGAAAARWTSGGWTCALPLRQHLRSTRQRLLIILEVFLIFPREHNRIFLWVLNGSQAGQAASAPPRLLILDEVDAALDATNQRLVAAMLQVGPVQPFPE